MLTPQIKPHFSLVAINNNNYNNTLKQQTRRQIVLIYKLFYEHFPTLRLGRGKIYAIISRKKKRFDQVSFSTRLLNNICCCCYCYCCCNWTCWRYCVVPCNCFTCRQQFVVVGECVGRGRGKTSFAFMRFASCLNPTGRGCRCCSKVFFVVVFGYTEFQLITQFYVNFSLRCARHCCCCCCAFFVRLRINYLFA